MLTLLFAVGYWFAVGCAVIGTVLLLTFFALLVDEALHGPVVRRHREPVLGPLRPFDQNDPLEQAWSLPSAPDPRRLV